MARHLAVVAALSLILLACGSAADESTDGAATTAPGSVTLYDELTNEHISAPFEWAGPLPPAGGDHYPFWHNCGFYDVALLDGAATHTLEHGVVWLTYRPDMADESVREELRDLVAGNDRLLVSPYDHPEPFVLTAWGAQLSGVSTLDAPEVSSFIADFTDADSAPEPGARCTGAAGVPPSDIRTLSDGSVLPEEWV